MRSKRKNHKLSIGIHYTCLPLLLAKAQGLCFGIRQYIITLHIGA